MSSLKEIKTRINSVKNTLKITSAMKMVAAAKLHKAQNAINGKLPYEQSLRAILAGMLQDDDLRRALQNELGLENHEGNSLLYLQDVASDDLPYKSETERVALVLFSSNSSLCGAFNSNIVKAYQGLRQSLQVNGYTPQDIDVYVIGRRIGEVVRKDGLVVKEDLSEIADKFSYAQAAELAMSLVESFASGEVGHVILLYSHFASHSSQPVLIENYLPLALHDMDATVDPVDYILEPDPMSLVRELLPMVLKLKLYNVLLDANAAEHAARTLAMQIASDNAKDLISDLTLAYNKGRQQEITAEILDLVGGTMA